VKWNSFDGRDLRSCLKNPYLIMIKSVPLPQAEAGSV